MAKVVVTGGNRGIGLELARRFKERGDDVVVTCRSSSNELDALGVEVHTDVDVTDDASVQRFASALGEGSIDVLVNNAGVLSGESLSDLDIDRIRTQLEVNSLGPLRVTHALRPALGKGAKVGIVTSRMGSVEDNTSGGMYGYRMSKAAANMAGRSLAHDLRSDGVAVALLHPGFVRTGMTGGNGHVDPDEAAKGLVERMDELSLETTGRFWHANGEELPW